MTDYVTVSFSGGKDSTAMLLHMIELGEQIDEVINCDTGLEYPAMYDHIERVKEIVEEQGIKYTTLRSEMSFEYLMFEKPIKSMHNCERYGLGWARPTMRWCTRYFKTEIIENYLKELRKSYKVIRCIGLAADEVKRLERPNNKKRNHRHPLVDWGWTEKKCLSYCKDLGFNWGGLYDIFDRVSCWMCPLQSLDDLRKLWWNYPELWHQLEEWEVRMQKEGVMGGGWYYIPNVSVFELAARFSIEKRREICGLSTHWNTKEIRQLKRDLSPNQRTLD